VDTVFGEDGVYSPIVWQRWYLGHNLAGECDANDGGVWCGSCEGGIVVAATVAEAIASKGERNAGHEEEASVGDVPCRTGRRHRLE